MAIKNQTLTVNIFVKNTSTGVGRTGDNSNLTLRIIKDGGTPASPTNSSTEVDATNLPGIYQLVLTASEMNASFVTVGGKSSTADTLVEPLFITTELLSDGELQQLRYRIGIDGSTSAPSSNTPNGISTYDPASDEVDIGKVKGSAVTGVNDFKASVSGLSTFDATTDTVDVGKVGGTSVTGPDDLKANVSSLSTLTTAQVNAEVADVLATDTQSEPSPGAPTATPTILEMVKYLYFAWRNKTTTTNSEHKLYQDDGTTEMTKSTITDNGTTATKGEFGAP